MARNNFADHGAEKATAHAATALASHCACDPKDVPLSTIATLAAGIVIARAIYDLSETIRRCAP